MKLLNLIITGATMIGIVAGLRGVNPFGSIAALLIGLAAAAAYNETGSTVPGFRRELIAKLVIASLFGIVLIGFWSILWQGFSLVSIDPIDASGFEQVVHLWAVVTVIVTGFMIVYLKRAMKNNLIAP